MTACVRFAPMIGARPGELSDQEAAALAEHLATCEACQARLADEEALSGTLSEALMAEANRRDFSTFSDEVLARIPAYSAKLAPAEAARRPEQGVLASIVSWARHHRLAAAASALAPTLAAAALILYFDRASTPEPAWVDVSAEGRGTMVLETNDGPVVLLGDPEPEGS
jgi:anti-sigma factor RsiW